MSASRFSRELRAIAPASAVTDEVGKSDGQLRRLLSPQARLALASCAMFSEGTCHSAVAQVDSQMVHVATQHERDWQRSGGIPGWSPRRRRASVFTPPVAWRLGFNRAATRGHQGAGASKSPSVKHVTGYEREAVGGWRGSDLVARNHRRRPPLKGLKGSGLIWPSVVTAKYTVKRRDENVQGAVRKWTRLPVTTLE